MKKLDKRSQRPQLSVSVVVPCAHSHVQHLSGLIAALHAQTRRPDQIVLAISGCEAAALPPLDAEVVHSSMQQTAGANRNRGSAAARGDVVIYQDADDVPHPQRVEIIAGLFEKYRIEHLMHFFDRPSEKPGELSIRQAVKHTRYRTNSLVGGVTNGNPAVARSVLGAARWPEHAHIGEDLEFNALVYTHTKWTAVLTLPLLTYRQHLSSFSPSGR